MVRKLQFHEHKLLKKVDFITWKVDGGAKETKIVRRYHVRKPADYTKYNKLSRDIRNLTERIAKLDETDGFKSKIAKMILDKLYGLGLISNAMDLQLASKVSASSFCRRRLPVIMVKNKLSQNLKNATNLIEEGHVRVGPDMVKDSAFLVSRKLEDFVTWVDCSIIKQHVLQYNDLRDDFNLL